MREATESRVFPLFSSLTSSSNENFFYLKNTHWQEGRLLFIRAFKEESQDVAIFDLPFDMTWHRIKVVQSPGVFERLWHKRSKVCKNVVSLNAFNAHQSWSQSYWHVCPRFWQGSNVWKIHKIFDSSFDVRQRWKKRNSTTNLSDAISSLMRWFNQLLSCLPILLSIVCTTLMREQFTGSRTEVWKTSTKSREVRFSPPL